MLIRLRVDLTKHLNHLPKLKMNYEQLRILTLSKKSEKLDKCEDRIKRFEKSIQDEINASVGSIVEKNKELITQMSDLQQENTEKD